MDTEQLTILGIQILVDDRMPPNAIALITPGKFRVIHLPDGTWRFQIVEPPKVDVLLVGANGHNQNGSGEWWT